MPPASFCHAEERTAISKPAAVSPHRSNVLEALRPQQNPKCCTRANPIVDGPTAYKAEAHRSPSCTSTAPRPIVTELGPPHRCPRHRGGVAPPRHAPPRLLGRTARPAKKIGWAGTARRMRMRGLHPPQKRMGGLCESSVKGRISMFFGVLRLLRGQIQAGWHRFASSICPGVCINAGRVGCQIFFGLFLLHQGICGTLILAWKLIKS